MSKFVSRTGGAIKLHKLGYMGACLMTQFLFHLGIIRLLARYFARASVRQYILIFILVSSILTPRSFFRRVAKELQIPIITKQQNTSWWGPSSPQVGGVREFVLICSRARREVSRLTRYPSLHKAKCYKLVGSE